MRVAAQAALEAQGVVKRFASAAGELTVLKGVELQVRQGEMVAVTGPSGIGKSTLLYILAGLDPASSGEVLYRGRRLSAMTPAERAAHRNRGIGFVWQLSNLLPDFTTRENVALPLLVGGATRAHALQAAERWLGEVGLAERGHHLAGELSGGEQQRAALARALVTEPAVLFADEPTGNLDAATSGHVFALLQRLHHTHGLTSVLATHNLALAGRCDSVWRLEEGKLLLVSAGTA
ncbi:MAG: ABC transporter ATP-binding protein [Terriglobia bacterium]